MIQDTNIYRALVSDCMEEILQSDPEMTESEAQSMAEAITYGSLFDVEILKT